VGDREAKEEARGFFFWKLFLCVQSKTYPVVIASLLFLMFAHFIASTVF